MDHQSFFIDQIKNSMMPSTGCTEPIAIALNTAIARREAKGAFEKLVITMDPYLYKNAMGVGIPGSDERGVALCAAMGVTAGKPELQMNVLSEVTPEALAQAKALKDKVTVKVLPEGATLFIQTELYCAGDTVRVITLKEHTNIIDVSHAPYAPYEYHDIPLGKCEIQDYTLDDFIAFANTVPIEELAFLQEGLDMNRAISAEGAKFGLGEQLNALVKKGYIAESPATLAKCKAASGSYARMTGVSLPVMTATGSGNQGITLFMTIDGVAEKLNIPADKELRAIALGALVNVYGKTYIGALSAVCACGVASGLGASVGICYMLDGDKAAMLGAAKNVLGAISGMICDGAKEGCAHKVELSAGLAVDAALLAVSGRALSADNGILADDLAGLFSNLGYLVTKGMSATNEAIVNIMTKK
ncbi:MAG: L-serine ammonia-lyase, iron-sulfur-dependent, subunit alpha [Eubacteriales bacterium]|nr:L-serine ammonia-lyase, iron-sulfur-dependent, subunit alpha [Eubacteriales bacterium]